MADKFCSEFILDHFFLVFADAVWIDLSQSFKNTGFNLHTECIENEAVNFSVDSEVIQCLRAGGVAGVECMLEDIPHYVTLTGFDGDKVYVFDPYFDENPDKPEGITLITDHPKEYNHIVDKTIMDSIDGSDYSMYELKSRIALCFYRTEVKVSKNFD